MFHLIVIAVICAIIYGLSKVVLTVADEPMMTDTTAGSCAGRPVGCINARFEIDEGKTAYCAFWDGGTDCMIYPAGKDADPYRIIGKSKRSDNE